MFSMQSSCMLVWLANGAGLFLSGVIYRTSPAVWTCLQCTCCWCKASEYEE